VIAHRLETIADADQISELARGRVLRATSRKRESRAPERPVYDS
jgi:ABC-type transport system involved in Fe-S cluster assembly fused permease/ATPase subunit